MTLRFPRSIVLEAYLGRWVDVTALPRSRSLRQADPVTVSWGSNAEQGSTPPSTLEGVLNNAGGHWTPGNPMSDYFDYLQGRNLPTRLGLRVSRDTGSRTVAGSWGTSDTSDGWNHSGVNDSYAVAGGLRTMTISAAASFGLAFLGDSYPDCQVADTAIWNMNVAGGNLEPLNLVLRYQASGAFAGEHYLLRVVVTPAELVTVTIWHSSIGAISSTYTIGTITPGGNAIRAKFQIEGQSLRGKVYAAGPTGDPDQFEPLDWQVSCHHERLTGGFPGVRTGVAAGNSNIPVTVSYDDWVLTLTRHAGELALLQPMWDENTRVKTAKIKCADVTQRLGRPQRPALSSSPRRYLASNAEFTTTDHWPLDESATAAAQGLSATGGGPGVFTRETGVTPNRGAVTWGVTDQTMVSVPAFATLSNGGRLAFPVDQTQLGTSWSVMWAMRLSPDSGAQVFLSTAGVTSRFVFFLYTDGTYELFTNPSGVSLATGALAPGGLQGSWCTLGLTTFNNGGAAVGYHLNVNGTTLGVGSTTGDGAHSPLREILIHVPQPSTGGQGDSAFSSVFVTSTRFDTSVSGKSIGYRAHWALLGWRGENAGLRAFRLCAEEGVPFDYWNDLSLTRPMGPQRPMPLLDNLAECAELDGAILYAPRYTAGIGLRPRRAMCAQSAAATLDYAAGQVAPQFGTSADDRPTANLVRAERVNGGFVIVEQASGPMNTGDPGTDPEAVGVSPATATVNAESDTALRGVASWVKNLGTVPEVRFPKVTVNLAARAVTGSVARQVLNLHAGDRLVVQNLTAADVYRDLDQIIRGGRETFLDTRQHEVALNTAPYEKYRTGTYGDASSRYTGAVTTLDAQLTSGTTGGRAITTTAGMPWTTTAAAYPLDVLIGGERCTVSGVTGTGLAAQTMTISVRAVNGVAKTHPAGTRVYLRQPVYYS